MFDIFFFTFKKKDVIYITMLNFILNNCQKEKQACIQICQKELSMDPFTL